MRSLLATDMSQAHASIRIAPGAHWTRVALAERRRRHMRDPQPFPAQQGADGHSMSGTHPLLAFLARKVFAALRAFRERQRRRAERREFENLDARTLRDLGVSRGDFDSLWAENDQRSRRMRRGVGQGAGAREFRISEVQPTRRCPAGTAR